MKITIQDVFETDDQYTIELLEIDNDLPLLLKRMKIEKIEELFIANLHHKKYIHI